MTWGQIKFLFTNWDQFPDRMERLGIFTIIVTASSISITFLVTLSHYQDELCFDMTQCFKLEKRSERSKLLNKLNFSQHPGNLWQSKIIVYTFSAGIFAYPLAVTWFPFICDYEPEQLFFESIIAPIVPDEMLKIASKICAAFL